MKQLNLYLIAGLFLLSNLLYSQIRYEDQPLVVEAFYYDETPPLRDMEVILPGERDRSWKDNIIQNKSMEDQYKNQRADIPDNFSDPVLQDFHPASREVTGPVMNFDGVNNVNGVYPPDTDGDVGPDHYFQMINLSFAIWDKQGNKLFGPVDNSTLWSGFIGPWTGTNDGDPIVLYDELADRWMASQFAINTSNGSYWQLVAVSTTPDPLGSYHRYAFQMPAFNDYPKLGVWPDAYYATFNMFGSYTRVGVAAFERDSMLVGSTARMVYYDQSSSTFSMQPADFDGTPPPAGAPCYFAHLRTYGSGDLEIYEFDVDWSDPSNSSFTEVSNLATSPFNPNINGIPQPGSNTQLDVLNMMLMFRLQYRNFGTHEVLMTNHTVNASGRAGIRWYEVRKDTDDWYIYQQGTYSPDIESRWMGSIAMNGNGDIALGFNISSSATYPSIFYTGRRAGDPAGTMTIPEVMVYGGTYSQSGIDRWGDYACLSVDPVDDSTFWFTTEYMGSGWRTRIASFDFGPLLPPQLSAGPDTVICETEPFMAQATASYQQSIMWETAGDGFFVDPTKVNAVYLRGQGDVTAGEVDLYVTAYGYDPGSDISDTLALAFSKMAVADAGNDTTINQGDDAQLHGEVTYTDTLYWTSDGDGTFDDTTILDPVYTPGAGDIENGSVSLWLNVVDTVPCSNETRDRVRVFIDELTGIIDDDGEENRIDLKVVPNPVKDIFTWSVSGIASGFVTLEITDLQGQVVFTQQLEADQGKYSGRINMSYLSRGVYVLKISSLTGTVIEKVLLQ